MASLFVRDDHQARALGGQVEAAIAVTSFQRCSPPHLELSRAALMTAVQSKVSARGIQNLEDAADLMGNDFAHLLFRTFSGQHAGDTVYCLSGEASEGACVAIGRVLAHTRNAGRVRLDSMADAFQLLCLSAPGLGGERLYEAVGCVLHSLVFDPAVQGHVISGSGYE